MRVLFALGPGSADPGWQIAHAASEMGVDAGGARFATQLVEGVLRDWATLDGRLQAASTHWTLDQMGEVERTILRMAAYEMGPAGRAPVRVAINEAVELTKAYAGTESARFVNGVLGRLAAQPGPGMRAEVGDGGPPGR